MEVTPIHHLDVPATTDLSQGIRAGPFIFLSGQIGVGRDGRIASEDAEQQMIQAFANVKTLLEAAGSSLADVVKITSYLTSEEHVPKLRAVRRRFFSSPFPASTLLVVRSLASPDYLYEVDIVAVSGRSHLDKP